MGSGWKLIDPAHPFYARAWRRWAIVLTCLAWALFEFASGAAFWGVLFGALGIYALIVLVVRFPKA